MKPQDFQRAAEAILEFEQARRWQVATQAWVMLQRKAPNTDLYYLVDAHIRMCRAWANAPKNPVHGCAGDVCLTVGCTVGDNPEPQVLPEWRR